MAKLCLYFSLVFLLLFLVAAGMGFLHVWINAVCSVPAYTLYLADFIPSAEWALPFTLYMTILMAMSYACRIKIPTPLAFILLFLFAFLFTNSVSLGISHAKAMSAPPLASKQGTLGGPGLILSGHGTTVVLLDGPAGGRVVSLDDRPLLYQPSQAEGAAGAPQLPSIPFGLKNNALFDSLWLDFSLVAKELSARFAEGSLSYAAYTGAIIFILLSLAALLDIGAWPLANIFIGAVLFRFMLSFEVFIGGRDTREYIAGFLGRWVPHYLTAPAVIGAIGILLTIYSALVYAARGGVRHHD